MFLSMIIIALLLILFGFLVGAGSMASFELSKHKKEVSKAYQLGYEMGRKAEQEKGE